MFDIIYLQKNNKHFNLYRRTLMKSILLIHIIILVIVLPTGIICVADQ
jgi:hypothetical protein